MIAVNQMQDLVIRVGGGGDQSLIPIESLAQSYGLEANMFLGGTMVSTSLLFW